VGWPAPCTQLRHQLRTVKGWVSSSLMHKGGGPSARKALSHTLPAAPGGTGPPYSASSPKADCQPRRRYTLVTHTGVGAAAAQPAPELKQQHEHTGTARNGTDPATHPRWLLSATESPCRTSFPSRNLAGPLADFWPRQGG
jgi:hypothetical protein